MGLYGNKGNVSLYGARSGISLRDEVSSLLRGTGTEVGIGQIGILRRLIRDSASGQPILCTCRKLGSKNHATVHLCDKCLNTGYIWTEEFIYYHRMSGMHGSRRMHDLEQEFQPGKVYTPKDVFYLEHHTNPTEMDCIIEIALDSEGTPVNPVVRTKFHNIKGVEEFRCDNGRREFWQLSCSTVSVGFFGQPLGTRVPAAGVMP